MSNGPFVWGTNPGQAEEPSLGEQVSGFSDQFSPPFQWLNWLGKVMFERFNFAGINGDALDVTAATTLDADSPHTIRYSGLSADFDQSLATTSVLAGKRHRFVNDDATYTVTVKSSNGDTIAVVAPGEFAEVFARIDTPTSSAHWSGWMSSAGDLVVVP